MSRADFSILLREHDNLDFVPQPGARCKRPKENIDRNNYSRDVGQVRFAVPFDLIVGKPGGRCWLSTKSKNAHSCDWTKSVARQANRPVLSQGAYKFKGLFFGI